MGTALIGSSATVRTSRKTRPENVAGTGTLYGKPFNGRSALAQPRLQRAHQPQNSDPRSPACI